MLAIRNGLLAGKTAGHEFSNSDVNRAASVESRDVH